MEQELCVLFWVLTATNTFKYLLTLERECSYLKKDAGLMSNWLPVLSYVESLLAVLPISCP